MPTDQPNDENRIEELPLALIDPDPTNVRTDLRPLPRDDELARSMAQVGLLHPIVVTRTDDGRFTVVVGHRRRLAALALGWDTIPARIAFEIDAQAAQYGENEFRLDPDPASKAVWVARLVETEGTQAKAAERLGLKRAMVGRYVAIAQGPACGLCLLSAGAWTLEQAYELAKAYKGLATRPSDDVMAAVTEGVEHNLAMNWVQSPEQIMQMIRSQGGSIAASAEAEARSARAMRAAETRRARPEVEDEDEPDEVVDEEQGSASGLATAEITRPEPEPEPEPVVRHCPTCTCHLTP